MSERTNIFDLKLLTSSKEIGLRRLRSYAASLGAGAQIYNSFDDVMRNLSTANYPVSRAIVLHDGTIPLTSPQLKALNGLARVFALANPSEISRALPVETAAAWNLEAYMHCSLNALLDSPIMRMSMAHLSKPGQPLRLENLLRWGHAAQAWNQSDGIDVSDAGHAFVKSLNLVGEARRLTEMFSHFVETRLHHLHLAKESVVFGADGLLTMVVARCRAMPGLKLRDVASELKVHDFTVGILNKSDATHYQIAALYYPFQQPALLSERIVMVLDKTGEAQVEILPGLLDKAG